MPDGHLSTCSEPEDCYCHAIVRGLSAADQNALVKIWDVTPPRLPFEIQVRPATIIPLLNQLPLATIHPVRTDTDVEAILRAANPVIEGRLNTVVDFTTLPINGTITFTGLGPDITGPR